MRTCLHRLGPLKNALLRAFSAHNATTAIAEAPCDWEFGMWARQPHALSASRASYWPYPKPKQQGRTQAA